jgi:hypothetical protein
MGGEAGQQGEHESAGGGGGIELLRHAADAHAFFVNFTVGGSCDKLSLSPHAR